MKIELLGTLFLSDKRKDLLLLLMEEPRNIDEIKDILNVTSSAIMTQIKILISQGLITHEDDLYKLSDIGKVVVKKMIPLLNTLGVFSENKDYWENHNISAIPPISWTGSRISGTVNSWNPTWTGCMKPQKR